MMKIKIKATLLTFGILLSVLAYGYDMTNDMFNYSIIYYEKRCNKVPERIKKGLRIALSEGYKGLAILKQDAIKGVTMLNDPANPSNAVLYFRDRSNCEQTLERMP
ncbi:MAG: hypothetical protein P8Q17_05545 [Methylophilaceae bacterium]|nr:hypothetical protein [Methylophilaceae bacterium]